MQELKNDRFNLVLVSLEMPFINGLEIVKFIRGDEELKALPIIIMIFSNDEATLKRIESSEINGYIIKPEFSVEDIDKVLKTMNRFV